MSFLLSLVFSATKLDKRTEQFFLEARAGGKRWKGEKERGEVEG
jgi:hypothetical protein